MIGIGLGGMDVAVIMSGEPLKQAVPAIVGVRLTGRLAPGVSAKDAALTLLKKMGVRGGVGKIFEYIGPGLANLTVPQRATLCNMGAEMGATSSLFSADERVREFLAAQGREGDFMPLAADEDAVYDKVVELDLSAVEPMVALPCQPDRGCLVQELGPVKFDQIFIGSCTNGSYVDLARAALIMKDRHVAEGVPVLVSCTNRQIFSMLLRDGYVQMLSTLAYECSSHPAAHAWASDRHPLPGRQFCARPIATIPAVPALPTRRCTSVVLRLRRRRRSWAIWPAPPMCLIPRC